MAVKLPIKTALIPNPLHKFASYTYSWSLWWLDAGDYNTLMQYNDIDQAMAFAPGPKTYVVAEDSGLYPDRRLPATFGLNYQIQDVQLSTTFGLNKTTEHSNLLTGQMTIVEPYGVTFIDSLVSASWDGEQFNNYTQQPYLLQLEFHGYDDNGDPIPQADMALYRKRFPITFLNIKVNVSNKGAEYKIGFVPAGHNAHQEEFAKTPKDFNVVAGTVKEFFDDFKKQYNEHFINQTKRVNAQLGENIDFDIDPDINNSKIVNPKETPITKSDQNAKDMTLTSIGWSIPSGTPITKIITKIVAQSSYLIDQLGIENPDSTTKQTSQTNITNLFRTIVQTTFTGINSSGQTVDSTSIDSLRNARPKKFTYKILQYSTWKGSHPAIASFPDSRPYTIKKYNYLYTGQNVDVLDLKMNFDTTFYTSVMSYNRQLAATNVTSSTGGEVKLAGSAAVQLIPSSIALGVPALLAVGSSTPFRVSNVVTDRNITTGMNTSTRPAAIVANDVLKSAFSSLGSGDMLKVDLQIVGDPTLLKQDDWLYVPSPTKSTQYNKWDTQSQADFAAKYGHVRGDAGELIVSLIINTPLDIDTDWTNNGLVFPQPGTLTSLFSGQYTILKIDSRFTAGKFEQTLHLARYINTDYVQAAAEDTTSNRNTPAPVDNTQNNLENSKPGNNSTEPPVPVTNSSDRAP